MSEGFFIGWAGRTGAVLGRFLTVVALVAVAGSGLLGWAMSAGADDPAAGLIGLAPPERIAPEVPEGRTVQGVLEIGPYPLLHLDPTTAHPGGETLLMALWDKRGVPVDPAAHGTRVSADGLLFRRGDVGMLLHGGDLVPVDGPTTLPEAVPLGRWRLAGEICDGKCYAGVMRPGSGLGHRACAQLCFVGEVPIVFVAAEPVAGSRFFVLGDADGSTPGPDIRHLIGVPVVLEGAVERRGGVLVLRADFAAAKLR